MKNIYESLIVHRQVESINTTKEKKCKIIYRVTKVVLTYKYTALSTYTNIGEIQLQIKRNLVIIINIQHSRKMLITSLFHAFIFLVVSSDPISVV